MKEGKPLRFHKAAHSACINRQDDEGACIAHRGSEARKSIAVRGLPSDVLYHRLLWITSPRGNARAAAERDSFPHDCRENDDAFIFEYSYKDEIFVRRLPGLCKIAINANENCDICIGRERNTF